MLLIKDETHFAANEDGTVTCTTLICRSFISDIFPAVIPGGYAGIFFKEL